MDLNSLKLKIKTDQFKDDLIKIYGFSKYENSKKRYLSLLENFTKRFDSTNGQFFSSPGRTELCGNHTDHNNGLVLASSIDLDTIALVSINFDHYIRIHSEGFPESFIIDINALEDSPSSPNLTQRLINGLIRLFYNETGKLGGMDCYISSNVHIGSGLSSSASFEILLCSILNTLFNNNELTILQMCTIGKNAENLYLNKPSGLMDQMACAHGGIISIDFKDPENPLVEKISYSFEEQGYQLLVLHSGGSHADLTSDYAAIPDEMKLVCDFFNVASCRDLERSLFYDNFARLSKKLGDRPPLRVLHYFEENKRVIEMIKQLKNNNFDAYLHRVKQSGDSSYKYLQNSHSPGGEQKIPQALALCENFENFDGVARIHGGGFAGTIQIYILKEQYEAFKVYMESYFGTDSVTPLNIRKYGVIELFNYF